MICFRVASGSKSRTCRVYIPSVKRACMGPGYSQERSCDREHNEQSTLRSSRL